MGRLDINEWLNLKKTQRTAKTPSSVPINDDKLWSLNLVRRVFDSQNSSKSFPEFYGNFRVKLISAVRDVAVATEDVYYTSAGKLDFKKCGYSSQAAMDNFHKADFSSLSDDKLDYMFKLCSELFFIWMSERPKQLNQNVKP